jgi:release factor glutamine methyltransferase
MAILETRLKSRQEYAVLTVAEALQQGTVFLREQGSPSPRLDAEVLLAQTLGLRRVEFYVRPERPLGTGEEGSYQTLLLRRARGEPVSYILGQKEFFGLTMAVDRRVLVPRPETEVLVGRTLEHARALGRSDLRIADIGTGSGCIVVALAAHLPAARFYATDISPEAAAVAQENLRRHGVSERVRVLVGDLCAPLPEAVDLLVSNPPYTVWATLPAGITAYEPRQALDGGADGLEVYRRLLPQIPGHLGPGGGALLEIGDGQAADVLALAGAALPGVPLRTWPDYSGIERVVEIGPG